MNKLKGRPFASVKAWSLVFMPPSVRPIRPPRSPFLPPSSMPRGTPSGRLRRSSPSCARHRLQSAPPPCGRRRPPRPPLPAVIQRLVKAVILPHVPPAQPLAIDEDDPAQHFIVYPRPTMALRENTARAAPSAHPSASTGRPHPVSLRSLNQIMRPT